VPGGAPYLLKLLDIHQTITPDHASDASDSTQFLAPTTSSQITSENQSGEINNPVSVADDLKDIFSSSNWDAEYTRTIIMDRKNTTDFAIVIGDIGYADDAFLFHFFKLSYEAVTTAYQNWMEPITGEMALMVRGRWDIE
jgi:hypothetical protein